MPAVRDSEDLARILALPRRTWSREDADAAVQILTDALRTTQGTMRLFPIQAIALTEMARHRGLVAPIPVGGGKTLISLLAPRMFRDVQRPLLLVPAHLRDKTRADEAELRHHWALPPNIRIQSYQTLSRVNAATFLDDFKPDLIIADECHYLRNPRAACTRRVTRYLRDRPDTIFVGMSGTLMGRSIRDMAHLCEWGLHDGSPVPIRHFAVDEWARALDSKVSPDQRMSPGALARLRSHQTQPIREAFRDRFLSTPGVVAFTPRDVGVPLTIQAHLLPAPPGPLDAAWKGLREEWITPDGWECVDGIEVWRHAREIGLGCFYVWDPRPPDHWIQARRAWGAECRYILQNNRRNLDTELQVKRAIDAGQYPEAAHVLARWREVEPTFIPNVRAEWVSDHALRWIREWAARTGGIVWVDHVEVGHAIGLPYYAEMGIDRATGKSIEKADPADGPIVASIAANATGRNLQRWTRHLVVGPPPNGARWEQLLGRSHRTGQTQPVHVDVLIASAEDHASVKRAIQDSIDTQAMLGQPQKLARLTPELPAIAHLSHLPQWSTG